MLRFYRFCGFLLLDSAFVTPGVGAHAGETGVSPSSEQPMPAPDVRPSGIMCTMEAKLCPDGSYVSRTGPKCDFRPCPSVPAPTHP